MVLKKIFRLFFASSFFFVGLQADEAKVRPCIVVTGASGEIGGATAFELACDNDLILTGRNVVKLQKLTEEIQAKQAGKFSFLELDYANKSSIKCFKEFLDHQAPIAGLVLITPRPQFQGKELLQDESVWLQQLQETFTGPAEVIKSLLPHFVNPSKVVVIAGTTSVQLQPEYGPSCVIRRMWTTYVKALSHQLGPRGVTINALSPGVVMTPHHQERIQRKADQLSLGYDEVMATEVASIPLKRHAQPHEVAKTIKFLLSEESNFVHGINLIIDGGITTSY